MFFVVLDQRGESICKTVKIKRRDHAVCAVSQLRLPHGDAFALINGRLHVNVAHTHVGVRVLLFTEQHDEIFHMHSLNGFANLGFPVAVA